VKGWLPEGLEALLLRCLAKRPQERPEDARALLHGLRAIAIPDEHAWTDEHARAWWSTHRAPVSETAPAMPTSAERVVVPQRDESPTVDQRRSLGPKLSSAGDN
jgi:serine/threonine-protein kinase